MGSGWILTKNGKRVAGPFVTKDAALSYGLLILGDGSLRAERVRPNGN